MPDGSGIDRIQNILIAVSLLLSLASILATYFTSQQTQCYAEAIPRKMEKIDFLQFSRSDIISNKATFTQSVAYWAINVRIENMISDTAALALSKIFVDHAAELTEASEKVRPFVSLDGFVERKGILFHESSNEMGLCDFSSNDRLVDEVVDCSNRIRTSYDVLIEIVEREQFKMQDPIDQCGLIEFYF